MTFGEEARDPTGIVLGYPSFTSSIRDEFSASEQSTTVKDKSGTLQALIHFFLLLFDFFDVEPSNMRQFHSREKECYDLRAVQKIL